MTENSRSVPAPYGLLRAGPVSMWYSNGELRHLRSGESELVRRIYVAVRDEHWATTPMQIVEERVEEEAQSFRIIFRARHFREPVDFSWTGSIIGSANGSLEFTMDGQSDSDFLRSRIGFCILHPLEECMGMSCTMHHPDGSTSAGLFPELISPEQPFINLVGLDHDTRGGARVSFRFTGDVFETEDQRNWMDASFKTYCTPQTKPKPVEVRAGDVVKQGVSLRVANAAPVSREAARLSVAIGEVAAMPKIGALWSEGLDVDRMERLALSHLRVDLPGQDLTAAAAYASAVGAHLEVAIHGVDEGALDDLQGHLDRIARCIVLSDEHPVAPSEWLDRVRQRLPGVVVLPASQQNFTELNRNRPEGAPAVAFGAHPQVHAVDDLSIMETPEGFRHAIRTAHSFSPGVCISPLSFGSDDRRKSDLGAAWALACLSVAVQEGATSMTFSSAEGAVDELFAQLASASTVRICVASDPYRIAALALERPSGVSLLLANLTSIEQTVDLTEPVVLGAYETRMIQI